MDEKKITHREFLLALTYILVKDARQKGCIDDLYLGSIKLPNFDFLLSEGSQT